MSKEEAGGILDKWLHDAKRSLTSQQRQVVLDSFNKCPLPLFLKLAFDEACRWKSFTPDKETMHLPSTIREMINSLFDRLERLHGKLLISRSLAYISSSKNGLTQSELEDLLSLDDEVLNDVYQYWTPPVRRLPPLLWLRVRGDLGDYLVERGSDGARVSFWYHRQFIEVSRQRYLQQPQSSTVHSNIAEYFLGKWSDGKKKPFINKKGEHLEMDRLVAQQPLMYDTSEECPVFNKRKLAELPYHLMKSKRMKELKEAALCNYDFLLAKIRSMSHGLVMEDLRMAVNEFPDDEEFRLLYDTLGLCTNALKLDPKQLPSQLIGRLFKMQDDSLLSQTHPSIAKLFEQLRSSTVPYFVPNFKCLTSSGGPLLHAIAEHGESMIDSMCLAHDNSKLLTTIRGNEGLEIRVFNLRSGMLERKLILTEPTPDVYYTWHTILSARDKDKLVLIGGRNLLVLDLKNGQVVQTLEALGEDLMFNQSGYEGPPVALGNGDQHIAALTDKGVKIWNIETGKLDHEIPVKGIDSSGSMGALDASKEHVAFCKKGSTDVVLVSITSGKKVQTIKSAIKKSNDSYVKCIRVTDQNKVIVLSSNSTELKVYDIASGQLEKEVKGFSTNSTTKEFIITKDGKKLVCQDKYELAIWDMDTWRCRKVLQDMAHVHSPLVKTIDGRIVAHANISDRIVRVYDASKDESKETTSAPTTSEWAAINQIAALHPGIDGRHFIISATVNMTNEVSVWDAKQAKKVRIFKNSMFYPSVLRMVSPTIGVAYIYNDKMHHYVVLDFAQGKMIRKLEGKACKRMYMMQFLDSNRMVSFSRGRRNLKIWDIQSGKVVEQIKIGQKHRLEAFVLSGDKATMVLAQAGTYSDIKDKTVPLIVYNFTTGKHHELREEGEQLKIETIGLSLNACLSHSGRYMVSVNEYTNVALWDVQQGQKTQLVSDNPGAIYSVGISEKKNIALTAYTGSSNGIHIWDIQSGKCLREIVTSTAVNDIKLSVEENLVFSKDMQGTSFYVHELDTGRSLATFTSDQPITPQAFDVIDDRVVMGATGAVEPVVFYLRRPNDAESTFEKASGSIFEDGDDINKHFDYNPSTTELDKHDVDDDKDDDKGQAC